MREVDRRTKVGRRGFLRGSATIVPAAAFVAAGATITPDAAWAQEPKALKPATLVTLVKMARDIYPHDHIADVYYVNAITPWDDKAAGDKEVLALLEQGVARLDEAAMTAHATPYIRVGWEADRVSLLRGIETTPFFGKIRSDLVVSLYNQHDLWQKFGYEGSSAEHSGYLHRGFNDIDWLTTA